VREVMEVRKVRKVREVGDVGEVVEARSSATGLDRSQKTIDQVTDAANVTEKVCRQCVW